MEKLRNWFTGKIPIFWSNWVCAAGSVLSVTVVILMFCMLVMYVVNGILSRHSNPYVDLIAFMMLPAFLGLGVILLLVGNVIRRRREKRGLGGPGAPALGGTILVRKVALVGVVGLIFLVAFGTFSYEAYHFTDSNQFCSKVCHVVMKPEATAHARSPHANVHCVACHIGPGASWFVRAKLSGLRQVAAVATNSYSRPIPAPVENLRPARDTCEVCHWPTKFHGSKLAVKKHYAPNRANTESITANLLFVGGPDTGKGRASGIHWHVDPANEVRYRHLDGERQEIVEVVQKGADGDIRYVRGGADADTSAGQWRVMDCVDCHNRPTHIYELPSPAVDVLLSDGTLDASVPYLKAAAVQALEEVQPSEDTTADVAARLLAIYAADHPEDLASIQAVLPGTARELAAIIERNIYPEMGIVWGTYRSNLSHFDLDGEIGTGGCFRCHDDEIEAENGDVISQDCDLCHNLIAYEEPNWKGLPGVSTQELFAR